MADISKIILPSGAEYDIKDATARQDIAGILSDLSGAMHWVGVTTTPLTDGSTTQKVTIDSEDYTAQAGDVVAYGSQEFIWSDVSNSWRDFGSLGSLKALAFKDSATGTVTATGTVSKPTFTGTKKSGLTVSPASSGTATYTPGGTVSQPTFTGTAGSASATYTPAGSVTVKAGTNSKYSPAGTVTQPTFTGTAATLTVSPASSGTATYTPAGSVTKPDITVTPTTTTVNSITAVGTLPSLTTTVANETLTIGFNQGTLPTKGSGTTVMTGASAALNSAPTFSGTGARLTASYTPAGTVSQPTFSGTEVTLSGTFSGTQATITSSYTPAGTVSQPTFTGTGKRLVVEDYTPAGTVSQPTFTGNGVSVTVS